MTGVPAWAWVAVFSAGVATGTTVWTLWGWPWMRDRYYASTGLPPPGPAKEPPGTA